MHPAGECDPTRRMHPGRTPMPPKHPPQPTEEAIDAFFREQHEQQAQHEPRSHTGGDIGPKPCRPLGRRSSPLEARGPHQAALQSTPELSSSSGGGSPALDDQQTGGGADVTLIARATIDSSRFGGASSDITQPVGGHSDTSSLKTAPKSRLSGGGISSTPGTPLGGHSSTPLEPVISQPSLTTPLEPTAMQPSGVDSGIHPTPGTSPGEHINWPKASKSRHLNELRWWLEEYGIPELFDPLHEQLGVWTVDLLCDLSVNEANELENALMTPATRSRTRTRRH